MICARCFIPKGDRGFFAQEQRAITAKAIEPPIEILRLDGQVLGCIGIRCGGHFLSCVAEYNFRIIAPSGVGIIAVKLWQILDQRGHQQHYLFSQRAIIGHQPNRGVIAMLGLTDKIGCNDICICMRVGQNQAICWSCDHINANAAKKHAFGFGNELVSRPNKNISFGQPK